MPNVLIKRTGHPDFENLKFAHLEFQDGDTVSHLALKACTAFPHWHANADEMSLFLVTEALARKISAKEIVFDHKTKTPLFEGDALASADVVQGSYLLALVPPPAPGKNQPLSRTLAWQFQMGGLPAMCFVMFPLSCVCERSTRKQALKRVTHSPPLPPPCLRHLCLARSLFDF